MLPEMLESVRGKDIFSLLLPWLCLKDKALNVGENEEPPAGLSDVMSLFVTDYTVLSLIIFQRNQKLV